MKLSISVSRAAGSSLSGPHSDLVVSGLQQTLRLISAASQESGGTQSQSQSASQKSVLDSYIAALHSILSHQSNSRVLDLLLELFFRPETTVSSLGLASLRAAMLAQKHHVLAVSAGKMVASSNPHEILTSTTLLCPGEQFSEHKQFLGENIHNILPTVLLQAGEPHLNSRAEQTLAMISK